jgi:hypothetical protein
MSESPVGPTLYRVSYSGRVQDQLRLLVTRARERGLAPQVLAALRAIDERLRLYPQFGQPFRDLTLEPAKLWVGVVPPLVVQYFLDEERRLVMVGVPILPLPNSGLDA